MMLTFQKSCIIGIASLFLMVLTLPVMAQGGGNSSPYDPTDFRPLGRFTINANELVYSPDGYHIIGLQEVLQEPAAEDETAEGTSDETDSADQEPVYVRMLTMWDIRGGKTLWSVQLPDRDWERIEFSPDGTTIMVQTTLPYPNEEEVRLTFYDAATGEIISQTGNIDIINAPIIPGDLPQGLYAEPHYTADGEHVVISYYRRTEAPQCGIWEVALANLLWEKDTLCGSVNADGLYMLVPEPHANTYSAYRQLAAYDMLTGELVSVSEDEVAEYSWLDTTHVLIHRPYGDPPIVWDILSNTRAVLELPSPMGMFWPDVLQGQLLYDNGSTMFVWEMRTGKLLREVNITGQPVIQPDRVLFLQTDDNWYELEPEDRNEAFVATDFETAEVVWKARWQHDYLEVSPDGLIAAAFDGVLRTVDIFDLTTGKQLGSIPTLSDYYYLTPEWDWLVQPSYDVFVVWGPPSQVGLFEDVPSIKTVADTELRYEPIAGYSSARTLPAGQYLWAVGRTGNSAWIHVEDARGSRYWVEADTIELLVPIEEIPSDE